jgi:hypothetical protein
VRRRGATTEEQLPATFDALDEWFQRDDFDGCSFIKLLLQSLAQDAGLRDSEAFAGSCRLRMEGSIATAAGDPGAAQRGKAMARTRIGQHR